MKAVYRMAILMTVAVTVCVDASAQNITLANTELVLTSAVRLRIPRLRGQLIVTTNERPVPFHPDSFTVRIEAAEVRFSTSALTALMNGYVLEGANIQNVTIKTNPVLHEVIIKGPIALSGPMSVSDELIYLRRDWTWVPFLDRKINWNQGPAHGIVARNPMIILDPIKMIAPLLRIEGHLTAIAVEGDEIVETFGPAEVSPSPAQAGSMRIEGEGTVTPGEKRAQNGWLTLMLTRNLLH